MTRKRHRCKAAGTYCRVAKGKTPLRGRRKALPRIISDIILPPTKIVTLVRAPIIVDNSPRQPSPETAVAQSPRLEDGEGYRQYVNENCVIITYYQGDVASAVDAHFTRSLASDEVSTLPPSSQNDPLLVEVCGYPAEPLPIPPVAAQQVIPPPPPVMEILDTATALRVEHGTLGEFSLFDICNALTPPLQAPDSASIEQDRTEPEWLDALLELTKHFFN